VSGPSCGSEDMLNLDPGLEPHTAMSLLEPRFSDLRAGFGGYGFSSPGHAGLPPSPLLPLWQAPPRGPPVSMCTIPSCPCALSVPRLHFSTPDMYDYPPYYPLYSWYLKSGDSRFFYSTTVLIIWAR